MTNKKSNRSLPASYYFRSVLFSLSISCFIASFARLPIEFYFIFMGTGLLISALVLLSIKNKWKKMSDLEFALHRNNGNLVTPKGATSSISLDTKRSIYHEMPSPTNTAHPMHNFYWGDRK